MQRISAAPFRLSPRLLQPLAAAILGVGHLPLRLWQRSCYRQQLARLLEGDPRLIRDIGMTVEDAEYEAQRPFWKNFCTPLVPPF